MKIDLTKVILELDGKTPIKIDGGKEFTVKDAFIQALMSTIDGEKETGQRKAAKFAIALKIQNFSEKVIELKTDEIQIIKDMVGKCFVTLIVGRIYEIIGDL